MTVQLECGNEEHGPRPAVAIATWPSGRFHTVRACRDCLDNLLAWYVLPGEDLIEGPHPVQIEAAS